MDALSEKIISVTKRMRKAAYESGEKVDTFDVIPFGGSIRESIGPFPEFILKGRFCKRSERGMCSPCFYSRLPVHQESCEDIDSGYDYGYREQVKHISDHFQEKFLANQKGEVARDFVASKPVYAMVCTPTGSYFDNNEYPEDVRVDNLRTIVSMADEHGCEIVLHIESHAEDIIQYFKHPNQEELALLKKLHTRALIGFESNNEFSRNVIYAKNLSLDVFETAVNCLKNEGFAVGAFVFAGLIAMTEKEIIGDVVSTFEYLKKINVSPVLMFANTQPYTIPDVLWESGKYKLVDPRTVCEIVKRMIDIFGCDMKGNIDPWFIADPRGGPPEPNVHLFNVKTKTVCDECADIIYSAIEELRIKKDAVLFFEKIKKVDECSCSEKYDALIHKQDADSEKDIHKRVEEAVDYADMYFDQNHGGVCSLISC